MPCTDFSCTMFSSRLERDAGPDSRPSGPDSADCELCSESICLLCDRMSFSTSDTFPKCKFSTASLLLPVSRKLQGKTGSIGESVPDSQLGGKWGPMICLKYALGVNCQCLLWAEQICQNPLLKLQSFHIENIEKYFHYHSICSFVVIQPGSNTPVINGWLCHL